MNESEHQCITDLSVKYKTIEILNDNIRENLNDLGYDNNFLDTQHLRHNSGKKYLKNWTSLK